MNTILYYTNNLISPEILKNTLLSAASFCKSDDCELVITSHFPITKDFAEVPLAESPEEQMYSGKIDIDTHQWKIASIYRYLAKDLRIDLDINHKSYVVGKLPYTQKSIIKQILFALSKASGDKVIFMEHDCFYPHDYVACLKKNDAKMHYCFQRCCFLDSSGFFKLPTIFLLSGCSGNKELFTNVFQRKLELLNAGLPYRFEPILNTAPDEMKAQYKDEIFISGHLCLDYFMPVNHDILDIKHKLNQGGQLDGLKEVPKLSSDCKKLDTHPYWGDPKRFIDMINSIDVDKQTLDESKLGVKWF